MSNLHRPLLAVATSILLSACGASPRPSTTTTRDLGALDSVTGSISGIPLTTKSADARNHFLQGQRELDLARNFEALDHFKRAVAADSTFAIAYLNVANTGNSFEEFKTNLARAEALAAGASDAEQLQIAIARKYPGGTEQQCRRPGFVREGAVAGTAVRGRAYRDGDLVPVR